MSLLFIFLLLKLKFILYKKKNISSILFQVFIIFYFILE
jgi:hypothetical protein